MNRPLHDLDDPTNYDASGYPLHQTSLWSQLYGRLHFVHFDRWPQGCEWLRARTALEGPGMPAWFTGNVIALCAVYFLDVVALIAGLVRA